jgi:3-hydroxyisobutyrate dehydrogenase-like beta-hydroxyacid dehydrogenase
MKEVPMESQTMRRIALIGFGEAGGILGLDLAAAGFEVSMMDILLHQESARPRMLEKARDANVAPFDSLRDAVRGAHLVISAVTCSAALDAAREAARSLSPGQVFLDINSVSPERKIEASGLISSSGALFVEAAVMAPVPPQRLKVPMLLGGAHAKQTAERLRAIGMNATAASDRLGVASAIKMCRSIIVKGLEALAVESLFAARRYGAEAEMLASLAASDPQTGWDGQLPDYLVSRVAEHGKRRAAEMREVAVTLEGVDLEPWMALATAQRQDWLVQEMAARGVSFQPRQPFSWKDLADKLLPQELSAAARADGKTGK